MTATEVPRSEPATPAAGGGGLDSFFKLTERGTTVGTEVKAGVTTFMVMAYIIFLNPNILSEHVRRGLGRADRLRSGCGRRDGAAGRPPDHRHGALVANYPIALAAGLGINAIVAFGLVLGAGTDAGGRDGRDRARGPGRARARPRRPARGDHEGGAALAEASDRRRHRPLHPVHRLRGRWTHRPGRRRSVQFLFPNDGGLAHPARPRSDDRPLGPEGAGGAAHQHHRHVGRRLRVRPDAASPRT